MDFNSSSLISSPVSCSSLTMRSNESRLSRSKSSTRRAVGANCSRRRPNPVGRTSLSFSKTSSFDNTPILSLNDELCAFHLGGVNTGITDVLFIQCSDGGRHPPGSRRDALVPIRVILRDDGLLDLKRDVDRAIRNLMPLLSFHQRRGDASNHHWNHVAATLQS